MVAKKSVSKTKTTRRNTTEVQGSARKQDVKLPVILMALPFVGITTSITLFAIANFIFSMTMPEGFINNSSPLSAVAILVNIVLFFIGAASVALGPISFIIGLVLLVTRLKKK